MVTDDERCCEVLFSDGWSLDASPVEFESGYNIFLSFNVVLFPLYFLMCERLRTIFDLFVVGFIIAFSEINFEESSSPVFVSLVFSFLEIVSII